MVEVDPADASGKRAAGRRAFSRGRFAEQCAVDALIVDGWRILGRRLRTEAGEIDVVAERDGIAAFVEVKSRDSLAEAAAALSSRQGQRLVAAAEILCGSHPDWGREGIRFDVVLVDASGRVRRIADAFRPGLG